MIGIRSLRFSIENFWRRFACLADPSPSFNREIRGALAVNDVQRPFLDRERCFLDRLAQGWV
jgi:hypothetical protein